MVNVRYFFKYKHITKSGIKNGIKYDEKPKSVIETTTRRGRNSNKCFISKILFISIAVIWGIKIIKQREYKAKINNKLKNNIKYLLFKISLISFLSHKNNKNTMRIFYIRNNTFCLGELMHLCFGKYIFQNL